MVTRTYARSRCNGQDFAPRNVARSTRGFTLIEILVVVVIVLIVSAVAITGVMSAIGGSRVDNAATLLQGALVGARDRAIHTGKPAGIRLIPDPSVTGGMAAANKIIDIQQGPDYFEGRVSINNLIGATTIPAHMAPSPFPPFTPVLVPACPVLNWNDPLSPAPGSLPSNVLVLYEQVNDPITKLPNSPTSWYWNIRIGDRLRFNDSGLFYTVIGPQVVPWGAGNPEGFVNIGAAGTAPPADQNDGTTNPEFLYLVNGRDDDRDGFVDNGFDGVDNNLNGSTDESIEAENEVWIAGAATNTFRTVPQTTGPVVMQCSLILNYAYSIERQPYPVQSAREISLPAGTVVDLTVGLTGALERSRLPGDPNTGFIDILVNPNGTWVPTTRYSSPSSRRIMHAFHFWIAERQDLHEDLWGMNTMTTPPSPNANPNAGATPPQINRLPMPQGTPNYTSQTFLTGERRLVTFFPRTGVTVTNTIENFDGSNIDTPYFVAEQGVNAPK